MAAVPSGRAQVHSQTGTGYRFRPGSAIGDCPDAQGQRRCDDLKERRKGTAMSDQRSQLRAKPGDVLAVHGHHLGEPERLGEILEVLGQAEHVHFRVRWDDDHESIFYPGSDATVRLHESKKVKKP
jgi:uncharacterized protein DUF1918